MSNTIVAPSAPISIADIQNKAGMLLKKSSLPSSEEEAWRKIRIGTRVDKSFFQKKNSRSRIDVEFKSTASNQTPDGVHLLSFNEAFQKAQLKKTIEKHFKNAISGDRDYFFWQNLAEWKQGILIDITKPLDGPIIIHHHKDDHQKDDHHKDDHQKDDHQKDDAKNQIESSLIHHVIIYIAENITATVIEKFHNKQEKKHSIYWNTISTAYVAQNTTLHYLSLRDFGENDHHFQRFFSEQKRDSRVFYGLSHCGGLMGKGFLHARLLGSNAEFQGVGIHAGSHKEFHDMEMFVEHQSEHTQSSLLYKAIVSGNAHSVFDGQLKIPPNISDIHSHQMNQNILLSPNARAESMPRLVIQTENVFCEHGATVGMLDQEVLFYLLTRGLNKEEAQHLMIEGFLEDAISQFPLDQEEHGKILSNIKKKLGIK